MGGHAVMFSDEYQLALSLGSTSIIGFNLGGELDVPTGRRTAVTIGYGYFGAPARDVTVRVSSILNAGEVANEETVASISQHLPLAPVRLEASGSRVVAGVKVAFR
jgi:hypothetical protein